MTRIIPSPKFLIASVLLVAFLVPLAAQERLLIPYRKGTKWGFCDEKKNIVIAAKYAEVREFENGYAEVDNTNSFNRNNNDYFATRTRGLIDKNGKEILPLKYVGFSGVYQDVAAVSLAGNDGSIDALVDLKTGQYVVQPGKYKDIYMIGDGFRIRTWQVTEGYIDKNGTEIIRPQYESIGRFNEGFAEVKKNGKYGIIDRTGRLICDFKYDGIMDFSQGLASVRKTTFTGEKHGFINMFGIEVIPLQYLSSRGGFSEGLAAVLNNQNRWLFIDKEGTRQINEDFFEASNFKDGLALVQYEEGGNHFFIDKTGKKIISLPLLASKYSIYDFRNGLAQYFDGKLIIVIDKKGKVVAQFHPSTLSSLTHYRGSIFKVCKPGTITPTSYCYINILDGTEYCDE